MDRYSYLSLLSILVFIIIFFPGLTGLIILARYKIPVPPGSFAILSLIAVGVSLFILSTDYRAWLHRKNTLRSDDILDGMMIMENEEATYET